MSSNSEQLRSGKIHSPHTPHDRDHLGRLPAFYAEAIFRPTARTFAHIAEYARWRPIWIQLAILVAVPVLLGLFRGIFHDTSRGVDTNTNVFFGFLSILTVGATIGAFVLKIVIVPILFFLGVSLQFAFARLFKGQGSYRQQAFSQLTYQVPLAIIGGVIITVISFLHISTLYFSPLISLAFFVYGVFLNVTMLMGVHHLARDKAFASVVLPYAIGILAICGLLVALSRFMAEAAHLI
ncbi:YIP1 family protein [Tengunoibacter tsumagoiensis]|uniref:Yip1 domain-containing protein n=1 Tax=Tengunoibacter tsumagoiensis TaxID=2014871 RepID=A0A401ZW29_9CHLR|nr:YIP1 family protein [Tengunoibacter tsumagoiensis]GCE11115.1 hypothetical protein KTT_09740 [Tengunoibacter tsumagoiensis]